MNSKRFYRTRELLSGLQIISAIKCILKLKNLNSNKNSSDFWVYYKKYGKLLKALVRGKHLQSDIQSILELAAGDCYNLNKLEWQPDVIIDGGGNSGLFTLLASAKWAQSTIFCFEPLPENVEHIKKHIEANKLSNPIKVISEAIGNSTRKTKFYIREANQGSTNNNIDYTEEIEVNVFHLRKLYEEYKLNKVFIKLDIEGAEFEILEDFFKTGPYQNLIIVLEVHGNKKQQEHLLNKAIDAGFIGNYWEQAAETAHLFLASNDLKIDINKIFI